MTDGRKDVSMTNSDASQPSHDTSDAQPRDKRVVLVADDEPHVRLTLEYMLKRLENIEILSVGDGLSAIKTALDRKPDLILLYVIIPEIDGYTACRTIRDELGDDCGAIWLITGRYSAFDEDQASVVGADRFICKPFDPDEFFADAANVLGVPNPARRIA
jgi:DNA-binding response OmpR family regulator